MIGETPKEFPPFTAFVVVRPTPVAAFSDGEDTGTPALGASGCQGTEERGPGHLYVPFGCKRLE